MNNFIAYKLMIHEQAGYLSLLKKEYPDEWVLIGDPKESNGDVIGTLILHHESRKELASQFSKQSHQFTSTFLRYNGIKPEIGKWLRFTPLN